MFSSLVVCLPLFPVLCICESIRSLWHNLFSSLFTFSLSDFPSQVTRVCLDLFYLSYCIICKGMPTDNGGRRRPKEAKSLDAPVISLTTFSGAAFVKLLCRKLNFFSENCIKTLVLDFRYTYARFEFEH